MTADEVRSRVQEAFRTDDSDLLQSLGEELSSYTDVEIRAWSERAIGAACRLRCQFRDALEHFQRALVLFNLCGNQIGIAGCVNGIGSIHRATGNYPLALIGPRAMSWEIHSTADDLYSTGQDGGQRRYGYAIRLVKD